MDFIASIRQTIFTSIISLLLISVGFAQNQNSISEYINDDGTIDISSMPDGNYDVKSLKVDFRSEKQPFIVSDHPDDNKWDTMFGRPGPIGKGVNGIVYAFVKSGDTLFIGGGFTYAGGMIVNSVVKYNLRTNTWHKMGMGLDASVTALILDNSGNLYAGGSFTTNYKDTLNGIAMWDGTEWKALGKGITNGYVYDLATDGSAIYAVGSFAEVDGRPMVNIAKWTGGSWVSLGDVGRVGFGINAVAYGHSRIYIGGYNISEINGIRVRNVAYYSGGSWHPLGAPGDGLDGTVRDILVDGNKVYFCGGFYNAVIRDYEGGDSLISRWTVTDWDGSSWGEYPGTMGQYYYTYPEVIYKHNGVLHVGGNFEKDNNERVFNGLAKWSGSSWVPVGELLVKDDDYSTVPRIHAMISLPRGLTVGGEFHNQQSTNGSLNNIAYQNGTSWYQFPSFNKGLDNEVFAIAKYQDKLYVGGRFTSGDDDGRILTSLATWDGTNWEEAGGSINGYVHDIEVKSDTLFVAGSFDSIGNIAASCIAAFDGTNWRPLGEGVEGKYASSGKYIYTMYMDENEIIVGGFFGKAGGETAYNVAVWDGSNWYKPKGLGFAHNVFAIERYKGELYFGGSWNYVGMDHSRKKIVKYNELEGRLERVGDGLNGDVYALKTYNGYLYIGGGFTKTDVDSLPETIYRFAKWDGNKITQVGDGIGPHQDYYGGFVNDIAATDSGLYVGGEFTNAGDVDAHSICLWDGEMYKPLGSGVKVREYSTDLMSDGEVSVLTPTEDGLYVGGFFKDVGGHGAFNFTRWTEAGQPIPPRPEIVVMSPRPGDIWDADSTYTIRWYSRFVNNVKIEYTTNNGQEWLQIANSVAASQESYEWTVPPTPGNCLLKITDAAQPITYGIMDSTFMIKKNCIELAGLTICGDLVTVTGDDVFRIEGNARVNDVLKFDGTVVADKKNLFVEGNCKMYLDSIPNPLSNGIITINLYEGEFKFSVQDDLLNGVILEKANNLFQMVELPVELENIELVKQEGTDDWDGIRIDGKLELPEMLGHVNGEINTVQITRSRGLDMAGRIELNEVKIWRAVELRQLALEYNSIEEEFRGRAYLITKPFNIDAGALLYQGMLDSVGVWVELGRPIPIGTSGLSLKDGGGHLAGIARPPMKLMLGVSLVPTAQAGFDIVEFNHLELEYTFGESLRGSGQLLLFGERMAGAWVMLTKTSVGFGGDASYLGIFSGEADLTVSWNNSLRVNGNYVAQVEIPASETFPFDYISSAVGLPYTVARTENHIRNAHIYGETKITVFVLSYDVLWNDGLSVDWGFDIELWNKKLFENQYLMNNRSQMAESRFEGQSLIVSPERRNSLLEIKDQSMDQVISVHEPTPQLIVRVEGASNAPECAIYMPNGLLMTPELASTTPNVEYQFNEELKKAFYLFKNPELGDYVLVISGSETHYVDVYGTRQSARIEVTDIQRNGDNVDISLQAFGEYENAVVDVFFDNDNYGANGEYIAEDIDMPNGRANITWNTEDAATGTYYIYAAIIPPNTPPHIAYAHQPVKLLIGEAPPVPTNLQASTTDSSIVLEWEKNTEDTMYYNIYYSHKSILDFNSPSQNVGDTTRWDLTDLTPGRTYKLAVTASDTGFNESDFSNIEELTWISATENNAPSILESAYPTLILAEKQMTHQFSAFDPDGGEPVFTLTEGPAGMTLDAGGLMSWTPLANELGTYPIKITLTDAGGLKDSLKYRLTVSDTLNSRGHLAFDKATYTGYDDVVGVTLEDPERNTSSAIRDSIEVLLYAHSDRDKEYSLYLYEASYNTSKFEGSIGLTEGSETGSVTVQKKDTLTVLYYDMFPEGYVTTRAIFMDTLLVDVDDIRNVVPENYSLSNAYPNPFNPVTIIQYSVPEASRVSIVIYNALGEKVVSLVDQEMHAGNYSVRWDGKDGYRNKVASGIYFFRFIAEGDGKTYAESKKMILMK